MSYRGFLRVFPALALFLVSCGMSSHGGGTGESNAFLANVDPAVSSPDFDDVVISPTFTERHSIPDRDSHSGVFLDLVAPGSSSITTEANFAITVAPGAASLRVMIFDGNCFGLWDQNQKAYGTGGVLLQDGSIAGYDLSTPGHAATPFCHGESENASAPVEVVNQVKVFRNANDAMWESLYDGPLGGAAADPAIELQARQSNGSHRYNLRIFYKTPVAAAIDGYKLAANGHIAITPSVGGGNVFGGFIGGVVDSRDLRFTSKTGLYSVSRDHYPQSLVPPSSLNGEATDSSEFQPAVKFTSPDTYLDAQQNPQPWNTYTGTFDVHVDLFPATGQTWADYVSKLVLLEGDADDVNDSDTTDLANPAAGSGLKQDGTASPQIGGIPPDDGNTYTSPVDNATHNNSGYRILGSPVLEIFDPNGQLVTTLRDLSGNGTTDVSQADFLSTFERIPIPDAGPHAVAGQWTLRMHNLDARNTWFLYTNAGAPAAPAGGVANGRVFCDVNNDTTDNNDTDPGIGAVTVTLTPVSGDALVNDVVRTFTTSSGVNLGFWESPASNAPDALKMGTWKAEVINAAAQLPLAGKTETTPQPVLFTLTTAAPSVSNVDLGYTGGCGKGKLGGHVWRELVDCNGIVQANEPAVVGITVTLNGPGGLKSTTTNATGDYLFDNLDDGAYTIQVDEANATIAGYTRSVPASNPTSSTVTQGSTKTDINFGYCPKGVLGGHVFRELIDCNGVVQPGEPPVVGASVTLTRPDGTTLTILTDANGDYRFTGLADGNYTIKVDENHVDIANYTRSIPAANPTPGVVTQGSSKTDINFGYCPKGVLGGHIWRELVNCNGVVQVGEPPVVGATVTLTKPDGSTATVLTDANGDYRFTSLPDGNYTISVNEGLVVIAFYTRSVPATNPTPGVVTQGSTKTDINFGYCPKGRIQGTAFSETVDCNGILQPGEMRLANLAVVLTRPDGTQVTVQTDANGEFAFTDLADATYTVTLDDNQGALATFIRSTANPGPEIIFQGSTIQNVNFGYCPRGRIGGHVWRELVDCNGVVQPGEPPVAGVAVTLTGPSGPKSQFTNANGDYLFVNLLDGAYTIQVDEGNAQILNYTRSVPATNPVQSTVTQASQKTDLNFGYCPKGVLGGHVWRELLDCNGVVQPGEPPVVGISVTLTKPDGTTTTVLTDANGDYRFIGLVDGTYSIKVDELNVTIASYTRSVPATNPTPGVVTQGSTKTDVNFGYCPKGVLGGHVWRELVDCNGVVQPGEPPVAGISVTLTKPDGTTVTVLTDVNGDYQFVGLPDGTYSIRVDENNAAIASYTRSVPATNPVQATLTQAGSKTDINFGYCPKGVLGGHVWRELVDCNGIVQPGEPPVAGITVTLTKPDGTTVTVLTDVNGDYRFTGLPDGTYTVKVDEANVTIANYTRSVPALSPTPGVVTQGSTKTDINFGYCPKGQLGGHVFRELVDCNGVVQPGEPPVVGIAVTLTKPDGTTLTVLTDLNGDYRFNGLADGTYSIKVDEGNAIIASYTRSIPAANPTPGVVTQGSTKVDINFGYCPKGLIAGHVFREILCNGILEPGEPPVVGIAVTLTRPDGTTVTVLTDANGDYRFTGLADGTYTVKVDENNVTIANYTRSIPAVVPAPVTLTQGANKTDFNFAYCPQGVLGGHVFRELVDCNGRVQPGEPPVVGIAVTLTRPDGTTVTVLTNANGDYQFSGLADGTYSIRVDENNAVIASYTRSVPAANPTPGVVTQGSTKVDINFGYCPKGVLGGHVFREIVNCNGLLEPGEPPIAGIAVTLTKPDGSTSTVLTDVNGDYRFTGLADGSYTVKVDENNVTIANYTRSIPLSNPTPGVVTQGSTVVNLDFGYCPPHVGQLGGHVFRELVDCNGVVQPGEPPVGGVTVVLNGPGGTRTQLTNVNGDYLFTGLADGTYTIEVDEGNLQIASYTRSVPATNPVTSTVSQASTKTDLNFGYCPKGRIQGVAYAETVDCNGVLEPGERRLANLLVVLTRPDGSQLSIQTDANGEFAFADLPDATYTVTVDDNQGQLASFIRSTVTPGPELITQGRTITDVDFGYCPKGRIGGHVWRETVDCNGVVQPGEPAVAGVTVTLTGGPNNVTRTQQTNANGDYLFIALLDGTYTITVDEGNTQISSDTRSVPATNPVQSIVTQASTKLDLNFGYCPKATKLSGRVWKETDCDGVEETAEAGINGVRVDLFRVVGGVREATPIDFRTTAGDGNYVFDPLPAGTYDVVVEEAPLVADGFTRTFPAADVWHRTLAPGDVSTGNDFGYCKKTCECQSGKVQELCLDANIFLNDPRATSWKIYVQLDRNCPNCNCSTVCTLADVASFTFSGAFPGQKVGQSGLITVKDVTISGAYAKIRVCVDAKSPSFPLGYFDTKIHVGVAVNGCGDDFCSAVDCHCLVPGKTFPCDWKPRCLNDTPTFSVSSFVPFECGTPPPPPPPPCTPPPSCPCRRDVFGLGSTSTYGAFVLGGKFEMTGGSTLDGDLGLAEGSTATLSGTSIVSGTLFLDPPAAYQLSGGSKATKGTQNVSLASAVSDMNSAASYYGGLPTTKTVGSLSQPSGAVITGNGGLNVVSIGSIELQGGNLLTIQGTPNDLFIMNMSGSFVFHGGKIVLSGITPDQILWNMTGAGLVDFQGSAGPFGTFLNPQGTIMVGPVSFYGTAIAKNITLHSGGHTLCPSPKNCSCSCSK